LEVLLASNEVEGSAVPAAAYATNFLDTALTRFNDAKHCPSRRAIQQLKLSQRENRMRKLNAQA
jgi:hypothetical protein